MGTITRSTHRTFTPISVRWSAVQRVSCILHPCLLQTSPKMTSPKRRRRSLVRLVKAAATSAAALARYGRAGKLPVPATRPVSFVCAQCPGYTAFSPATSTNHKQMHTLGHRPVLPSPRKGRIRGWLQRRASAGATAGFFCAECPGYTAFDADTLKAHNLAHHSVPTEIGETAIEPHPDPAELAPPQPRATDKSARAKRTLSPLSSEQSPAVDIPHTPACNLVHPSRSPQAGDASPLESPAVDSITLPGLTPVDRTPVPLDSADDSARQQTPVDMVGVCSPGLDLFAEAAAIPSPQRDNVSPGRPSTLPLLKRHADGAAAAIVPTEEQMQQTPACDGAGSVERSPAGGLYEGLPSPTPSVPSPATLATAPTMDSLDTPAAPSPAHALACSRSNDSATPTATLRTAPPAFDSDDTAVAPVTLGTAPQGSNSINTAVAAVATPAGAPQPSDTVNSSDTPATASPPQDVATLPTAPRPSNSVNTPSANTAAASATHHVVTPSSVPFMIDSSMGSMVVSTNWEATAQMLTDVTRSLDPTLPPPDLVEADGWGNVARLLDHRRRLHARAHGIDTPSPWHSRGDSTATEAALNPKEPSPSRSHTERPPSSALHYANTITTPATATETDVDGCGDGDGQDHEAGPSVELEVALDQSHDTDNGRGAASAIEPIAGLDESKDDVAHGGVASTIQHECAMELCSDEESLGRSAGADPEAPLADHQEAMCENSAGSAKELEAALSILREAKCDHSIDSSSSTELEAALDILRDAKSAADSTDGEGLSPAQHPHAVPYLQSLFVCAHTSPSPTNHCKRGLSLSLAEGAFTVRTVKDRGSPGSSDPAASCSSPSPRRRPLQSVSPQRAASIANTAATLKSRTPVLPIKRRPITWTPRADPPTNTKQPAEKVPTDDEPAQTGAEPATSESEKEVGAPQVETPPQPRKRKAPQKESKAKSKVAAVEQGVHKGAAAPRTHRDAGLSEIKGSVRAIRWVPTSSAHALAPAKSLPDKARDATSKAKTAPRDRAVLRDKRNQFLVTVPDPKAGRGSKSTSLPKSTTHGRGFGHGPPRTQLAPSRAEREAMEDREDWFREAPSAGKQKQVYFLIVDTNQLIDELEILTTLRESPHVMLIIPTAVLRELNGLKGSRNHDGSIARVAPAAQRANQFCAPPSRDWSGGVLLGQQPHETVRDVETAEADDRILACAKYWHRQLEGGWATEALDDRLRRRGYSGPKLHRRSTKANVQLLTADLNVRAKAWLEHGIWAESAPNFLAHLSESA